MKLRLTKKEVEASGKPYLGARHGYNGWNELPQDKVYEYYTYAKNAGIKVTEEDMVAYSYNNKSHLYHALFDVKKYVVAAGGFFKKEDLDIHHCVHNCSKWGKNLPLVGYTRSWYYPHCLVRVYDISGTELFQQERLKMLMENK